MELLYLFLGLLGAWGFGVWCAERVKQAWANYKRRQRAIRTARDYYLETRELGYRICEEEGRYICLRKETVVSLVDGLQSITLGFCWTGQGNKTETIDPPWRLEDLPRQPGENVERREVFFPEPLAKGERRSYTFIVDCQQTGEAPEPFLSSYSDGRVDSLMLRVMFPLDRLPQEISYRIVRPVDAKILEEQRNLPVDRLSGQCEKTVPDCIPHTKHMLRWG